MIFRVIYKFLSSAKLAIVLLIVILVCCVAGVTIWRGAEAGRMIFSTLWFNGILVLLVVNVAFCFFPRMWGRRLTLISAGMILFHLSFVTILGGVVYNSLFYFRGIIRLTEGEALPSSQPESYDYLDHGRYFNFNKLKGETSLVRMHRDYLIDGKNKWAAYEIAVGEGRSKKQGIIYITHSLDHDGVTYLNEKEGYSVLIVLYDRLGRELYGAYAPLQSLRQKDGSYLYSSGTKDGPGSFPFPFSPEKPLFSLQAVYHPSKIKERGGEVSFYIRPLEAEGVGASGSLSGEGKVAVGEKFTAGDYHIAVNEIRYWVGMNVRYDPGKPIVLTSLWVGFGGMILTFIGRLRKKRKTSSGSDQHSVNEH